VENAVISEIYGKHDGACVSPLKSECTFYQSEIFSEQRFREALHTAIGDRMT
jgi:hypothetical protein